MALAEMLLLSIGERKPWKDEQGKCQEESAAALRGDVARRPSHHLGNNNVDGYPGSRVRADHIHAQ